MGRPACFTSGATGTPTSGLRSRISPSRGWKANNDGNLRRNPEAGPFLFLLGHTGSRAGLVAALVVFGVGSGFYDCNTMPVLFCGAPDTASSTSRRVWPEAWWPRWPEP
jgi:hypothetical protein